MQHQRRIQLALLTTLAVPAAGLGACGGSDETTASATPAAASGATTPPGGSAGTLEQPSYPALAARAIERVKAGATLIDVRTREEWDASHATPATLMPLATIEAGQLPDLPKSTEIYVYCRSGSRAQVATDLLTKAGFTNVTNIGGLTHWEGAGGAITS